jgi:arsenite/tail-anchored protein-transporting ATPase
MEQNTTGTSCLGPLAGLQDQQKLYQESVKALGDPAVTTLVLVARAEASALREAARTSGELAELGVRNQHLVVNGVFNAIDLNDPYAVALQQRGAAALAATPDSLKAFRKPSCRSVQMGFLESTHFVALVRLTPLRSPMRMKKS